MSVWIVAAASSAVCPRRSVQARVSVSPPVKNVEQADGLEDAREHRLELGRAVAERSGLLRRELGKLGFELEVEPARAVDDAISGFVVSGSSPAAARAGTSERVPASTCARTRSSSCDLLAEPRVARLRLLPDALEALLDVVAVGDDELELERPQVVVGVRVGRSRERRRSARPPCAARRDGGAQSRRVDDAGSRGRRLRGALDLGHRPEPLVRHRRHAHVLLAVRARRRRRVSGREERRLARARQPDDPTSSGMLRKVRPPPPAAILERSRRA